jgi:hypothetical protein
VGKADYIYLLLFGQIDQLRPRKPGACGDHGTFAKKSLNCPSLSSTPPEKNAASWWNRAGPASQKVADWLEAGGPGKVRRIGKLRSMVREMLAEELGQIDEWVEPLLHASER